MRELTANFGTTFGTTETAPAERTISPAVEVLTAIADRDPAAREIATSWVAELATDGGIATRARAAIVARALDAEEPTALDRVVDLAERVIEAEAMRVAV